MELAASDLYLCIDWTQTLCYLCFLPSKRGPGCISMDQMVHVWDIGALRKITVAPADDVMWLRQLSEMNTDFFGGVDAFVKYVLEGMMIMELTVLQCSISPSLQLSQVQMIGK
ncbi:hypothetical protein SLEP1_g4087 [Rubroshorea leprosula]|uniref:Uncharacterized protein n=1 Tax=Rubroshorea leprosula TaxID=152421 RepID=A0AAV5HY23_9ROSI|nr:hypothetical protein SLEP1_g4087 [Rubroshorea leprosula]